MRRNTKLALPMVMVLPTMMIGLVLIGHVSLAASQKTNLDVAYEVCLQKKIDLANFPNGVSFYSDQVDTGVSGIYPKGYGAICDDVVLLHDQDHALIMKGLNDPNSKADQK